MSTSTLNDLLSQVQSIIDQAPQKPVRRTKALKQELASDGLVTSEDREIVEKAARCLGQYTGEFEDLLTELAALKDFEPVMSGRVSFLRSRAIEALEARKSEGKSEDYKYQNSEVKLSLSGMEPKPYFDEQKLAEKYPDIYKQCVLTETTTVEVTNSSGEVVSSQTTSREIFDQKIFEDMLVDQANESVTIEVVRQVFSMTEPKPRLTVERP